MTRSKQAPASIGAIAAAFWLGAAAAAASDDPRAPAKAMPVRGIHLNAPSKSELPAALEFIGEALPREGVNTLILEFNYNFDFHSRPEFGNPSALGLDEVRAMAKLCRQKKIELIPQINCLGHQSWAKRNGRLLQKHPEFDETPGKYPDNDGIYCRSYCPVHPGVHPVLFDLIDELAKACRAKSFHVGMDEVFILADPDCPRCRGKSAADVFAAEVKTLRAHLKSIGCRMWMWGDRFIDAKATGLGKWEASENATPPASDLVPKDIVICDWHYDKAPETTRYFAEKGFDVVTCPWRKSDVALAQLARVRALRGERDRAVARHALGLVQTTWCGFAQFEKAYRGLEAESPPAKNPASESAHCFVTVFKAVREKPSDGQLKE